MGRVLVLGIGPLEFEGPTLYSGSANRVWQLARPLLDAGHQLSLVCMRPTGLEHPVGPVQKQTVHEGLTYYSLDEVTQFNDDDTLQSLADDERPDVIVAANVYPGARASVLKRSVPLFVDMNGYTMGEAQAKAIREDEDGYVVHFYHIVEKALSNGEAFSACSERYREGLIGELTVMGRDFDPGHVYVIPEAKEPPAQDPDAVLAFRREVASDDEFVVLWSGGYNTWADVDTLFESLEYAMRENPRIRYVSTGGAIQGHDEKTYPSLLARVETSPYRDRFTFLGWIPMDRARLAYHAADVGINADLDCFETRLGARNRITEMLATGLVPVTTLGTEITEIVQHEKLGLVTPIADVEALAGSILHAANHPSELQAISSRGRAYAEEHFTYDAAARPLVEWVRVNCG